MRPLFRNMPRMGACVAILFFACATTQAHSSPNPLFEQGFYVGGALAGSWGHTTWEGTSSISATNNNGASLIVFDAWKPSGDTTAVNPAGSIFLGYQFVSAPLYFAAELGGTFSSQYDFERYDSRSAYTFFLFPGYTEMTALATIHDSVTLGGNQFNLDIKPGWLVQDNMVMYARVGLAVNQLRITSDGTWSNLSSFFGTPSTLIVQDSSQTSNIVCGVRLGLGTEYKLADYLGLTFDYVYTDYGHIRTKSQNAMNGDNAGNNQLNVQGTDVPEVLVSTQAGMLGFIYHW